VNPLKWAPNELVCHTVTLSPKQNGPLVLAFTNCGRLQTSIQTF
jgi:hypothetical protein